MPTSDLGAAPDEWRFGLERSSCDRWTSGVSPQPGSTGSKRLQSASLNHAESSRGKPEKPHE
jgi:hypothetical protein